MRRSWHVYMLGATNVLGALGYGSPDNPMSLPLGIVASVAAFVVAAAVVYFFGFTKEELDADRAAA